MLTTEHIYNRPRSQETTLITYHVYSRPYS